jgi:hypothetical protein
MRAAIGKGSDTRQAAIRRIGQIHPGQKQAHGKDETQGSHLNVSGFPPNRAPFWPRTVSQASFPEFCVAIKKSFNCVAELFRRCRSKKKSKSFQLDISFMEPP